MRHDLDADAICEEFSDALDQDPATDIRAYWLRFQGDDSARQNLLLRLIDQHIFCGVYGGRPVPMVEYARQFPELAEDSLRKLHESKQKYESNLFDEEVERRGGRDPGANGALAQSGPSKRIPGFRDWELLGRGEMGEVWRGWCVALERFEAVKFLHAHVLDAVGREAVLKEAVAAARIGHPNICHIYEVNETGPYVRMEYVKGKTLDVWFAETQAGVPELAGKLAAVARAVHAAHERGVIHRDLKPANVLIEEVGDRPVVVDFGLAALSAKELMKAAEGGGLVGTLAVLAPEQIPSQLVPGRRGEVTARTDVYALGATFYWLQAGAPPFLADDHATMLWKIVQEPVSFPKAKTRSQDADFEAICRMSLAKDPEQRYATAALLAEDLQRYADREPLLHARRLGLAERLVRWTRRHRALAATAALLLLLAIISGRFFYQVIIRDRIVNNLAELLRSNPLKTQEKDEIQKLLGDLEARAPAAAAEQHANYIRTLVQIDDPRKPEALVPEDLSRLEWSVSHLASLDPGRFTSSWRNQVLPDFRTRAAPFSQSGSIYVFVRPDENLIRNRESVSRIEELLAPGTSSAAIRWELLKAYFAQGDLLRAEEIASALLARPNLSPAWRMTFLRDYVWIAIQLGDQRKLDRAQAWIEEALGPDPAGDSPHLSLLAEKARLLAARQLFDDAERVLDVYFDHYRKGNLRLELDAASSTDPRLGEGPNGENIPVLFFLEAWLLKGFIAEQGGMSDRARTRAREIWSEGFLAVRGHRAATPYEGAVLASLSGRLEWDDARGMLNFTSDSVSASQGDSPVAGQLKEAVLRNPLKFMPAPQFIEKVLRGSWVSPRGHEYARRIVFRQLSYGEFVHIQLQLWLFEGLRIAVVGNQSRAPKLSELQSDLLWKLDQDVYSAYAGRQLSEAQLVELVLLGIGLKPMTEWPEMFRKLPRELRGPVAYVLFKQARNHLSQPAATRLFFADFLSEASRAPRQSPLRLLAQQEILADLFPAASLASAF